MVDDLAGLFAYSANKVKPKPAGPQRDHHQSPSDIRGVRPLVAALAQSHEPVQVIVRAALRALDDVVNVEAVAAPTGLAAPAGSMQDGLPNLAPLGRRRGWPPDRPGPSSPNAPAGGSANGDMPTQRASLAQGSALGFCPRGQSANAGAFASLPCSSST